MPSSIIQADYDELANAANLFASEAGQTEQLQQNVTRLVGDLQGGGWIGRGAEAFFAEMQDLVLPAMGRLVSGLNDASDAAKRIAAAFQEAEENAGSLFRV